MEYPRFYIYAPRPYDVQERFYRIPSEQQELVYRLKTRGFEYSISGEECRKENLGDMCGLVLLKTDFGLVLKIVQGQQDLDNGDCEILVVQIYTEKLDVEKLAIIRLMFLEIYGLGPAPRMTRQMQTLYKYWSPPPRIYVVASDTCTAPGSYQ